MICIFSPHKCFPPAAAAHSFDRLLLHPGTNDLTTEQAEALKAHPDYPRYQKWGAIEWLESNAETDLPPTGDNQPADLSNFGAEAAETLINNCHDAAILDRWLSKEKRTTIRRLINVRLTSIKEGRE